jgi:hypothetical protein
MTLTEQKILPLWRSILADAEVGVEDDFFDSGGTSLSLLRLLSRIKDAHGVTVSPMALVDGVTLSRLAAEVDRLKRLATQTQFGAGR